MVPSKNKQEKRLRKAAEEIAMHKTATSESIKYEFEGGGCSVKCGNV